MAVQDEIPKSRLTLKYRTEINGEPEYIDLPLRMLVMGDFSQGTSKDRGEDLEDRKLRSIEGNNLNDVMKDMGMSLEFVVDNKIDPDKSEQMKVNVPIDSMKSFSPNEVAKNIPKLKSLLLLKKLLMEVQANVANKKEFRKLLSDLYANEDSYRKVLDELEKFKGLKLPEGTKGETKGDE